MALVTSQQISKFYDIFKSIEVAFTKQVIAATGLQTKQVFIKCINSQWPCVIYSSSMVGAKVVVNLGEEQFELIRKANNSVSLRFAFKRDDNADPILFFVTAKVDSYNPYNQKNQNLYFLNLNYTQRPADDLIEILGLLLEANVNSKKRSEERIVITTDSIRKLGLHSKDIQASIDGVPRKGIVRDLSFSGARVIILGIAKFLQDKTVDLKLVLEESKKALIVRGKVVRVENVEGRKDLAVIALKFEDATVPMEYKMMINSYLTHTRRGKEPGAASGQ